MRHREQIQIKKSRMKASSRKLRLLFTLIVIIKYPIIQVLFTEKILIRMLRSVAEPQTHCVYTLTLNVSCIIIY